jgi:hypothetical protein
MAQVGSTSGAAPAARESEVTPGGASGETGAGWPEPDSDTDSKNNGVKAGRVRGWLRRTPPPSVVATATKAPSVVAAGPDLDLASNDPLVGYLLSTASAVDITGLQLQSPALKALQAAGVVLVVPLISSGSLVGLLSLGPRRSERGYSTDDLRLLNSLAGMLVTLLVRANRQRQQLAAYGLSDHYREIFELTRLDEAITIYDSEESALNGVVR